MEKPPPDVITTPKKTTRKDPPLIVFCNKRQPLYDNMFPIPKIYLLLISNSDYLYIVSFPSLFLSLLQTIKNLLDQWYATGLIDFYAMAAQHPFNIITP